MTKRDHLHLVQNHPERPGELRDPNQSPQEDLEDTMEPHQPIPSHILHKMDLILNIATIQDDITMNTQDNLIDKKGGTPEHPIHNNIQDTEVLITLSSTSPSRSRFDKFIETQTKLCIVEKTEEINHPFNLIPEPPLHVPSS